MWSRGWSAGGGLLLCILVLESEAVDSCFLLDEFSLYLFSFFSAAERSMTNPLLFSPPPLEAYGIP